MIKGYYLCKEYEYQIMEDYGFMVKDIRGKVDCCKQGKDDGKLGLKPHQVMMASDKIVQW